MPLNAGVLIIGSLLWDSDPVREEWRTTRLAVNGSETVTAPIRYGRLSSSRGKSYTMVFSRLCQSGQAKLVPCRRPISSFQDLLEEAEWLWKAEQPGARPHRIAATWGCVALLCNPKRQISGELLSGWAERVAREPNHGAVTQTQEEGVLVSREGLLQIDWPRRVQDGTAVELDLLLATANDPAISASSPSYPAAEVIAEAWNRAGANVEYFWKNRDNGIQTFQDDEIRRRLLPRGQDTNEIRRNRQ